MWWVVPMYFCFVYYECHSCYCSECITAGVSCLWNAILQSNHQSATIVLHAGRYLSEPLLHHQVVMAKGHVVKLLVVQQLDHRVVPALECAVIFVRELYWIHSFWYCFELNLCKSSRPVRVNPAVQLDYGADLRSILYNLHGNVFVHSYHPRIWSGCHLTRKT